MISKKHLFTGLTIATLACPGLASALSLDVYNATNEDSTVRIKQSGLCSSIGGHVTRAHNETHTSQAKVKMLCLLAAKCDAVMYPSDNCTGDPVAHLSITTRDLKVNVNSVDDPRYKITVKGTRVDLGYR